MKRRTLLGGIATAAAYAVSESAHAGMIRRARVVMVGDRLAGKTWAGMSFTANRTPDGDWSSPPSERHITTMNIGGPIELVVDVLSGSDAYERTRPVSYAGAHLFMLTYAVNSGMSFDSVVAKWRPEVLASVPQARLVLVGLKSDLRAQGGADLVSLRSVAELAREFPAAGECSAVTQSGLQNVFTSAVQLIDNFDWVETRQPTPVQPPPVRRRRPF